MPSLKKTFIIKEATKDEPHDGTPSKDPGNLHAKDNARKQATHAKENDFWKKKSGSLKEGDDQPQDVEEAVDLIEEKVSDINALLGYIEQQVETEYDQEDDDSGDFEALEGFLDAVERAKNALTHLEEASAKMSHEFPGPPTKIGGKKSSGSGPFGG